MVVLFPYCKKECPLLNMLIAFSAKSSYPEPTCFSWCQTPSRFCTSIWKAPDECFLFLFLCLPWKKRVISCFYCRLPWNVSFTFFSFARGRRAFLSHFLSSPAGEEYSFYILLSSPAGDRRSFFVLLSSEPSEGRFFYGLSLTPVR